MLGGGESSVKLAEIIPTTMQKQVSEFLVTRFSVLRHVRDAMDDSQDKQKEQADAKGRGCIDSYEVGGQVLLNAKNLPANVVSAVFKTKLRPHFIGSFTFMSQKGIVYTLNISRKLRTHHVFYVGLLKTYHDPPPVDRKAFSPHGGKSSLLAASSSTGPPCHPVVAGCNPPSAVACRSSRSN